MKSCRTAVPYLRSGLRIQRVSPALLIGFTHRLMVIGMDIQSHFVIRYSFSGNWSDEVAGNFHCPLNFLIQRSAISGVSKELSTRVISDFSLKCFCHRQRPRQCPAAFCVWKGSGPNTSVLPVSFPFFEYGTKVEEQDVIFTNHKIHGLSA